MLSEPKNMFFSKSCVIFDMIDFIHIINMFLLFFDKESNRLLWIFEFHFSKFKIQQEEKKCLKVRYHCFGNFRTCREIVPILHDICYSKNDFTRYCKTFKLPLYDVLKKMQVLLIDFANIFFRNQYCNASDYEITSKI